MILLDTHVVAWLYAGELDRFPSPAIEALDKETLAVSAMVGLELQYLHEIGRVNVPAAEVLAALTSSLQLRTDERPIGELVNHAYSLNWTRDPFDRLITAHSLAARAPLMTADAGILEHHRDAFWG